MPGSSSTSSPAPAAALGAVSGLRTFTAPGVLAARGRWGRGPLSWILPLAAAGELLGDKLPVIPPRSDPASFIARVTSGAATGAAVGGARGAGLGATGAAATTYASERLRSLVGQRTGIPDVVLGAAEDAVAAGVAFWTTRGIRARTETEATESAPGGSADGSTARSAAPPEPAMPPGPAMPPRPATPPRPLAAVIRGLAAAAVGTAAMTSVQTAYLKATGGEPSEVPAEMGRRIVEGVLRRRVPRRRRGALNQAVHALYGTSWGLPLGLVAGSLRRTPPAAPLGAAFGLVVWGASLAALPALDLAPPPSRQPPAALAADLFMHLVYGTATGAAYAALGS